MHEFEKYPELSEQMQEYASFGKFGDWQKFTDVLNEALRRASTKENNAKVKALRKVANTKWAGTTIHDTMDKCLRAICLFSCVNSGHYNPTATRINGLTGWFMINQDGSLFCEARVIKEDEKKYRIEYMTNVAWNEFENDYCNFIDEE